MTIGIDLIHQAHDSLINGQRKQMAEQIREYGLYDFFANYKGHLEEIYTEKESQYKYFTDAVISFMYNDNR